MTWWRRLRTTWRSERGTQPLDYVGVTGVAMVVAGMIIVGIVAARGQLGAQMARVHAHIIASFEQGRGGTINHNHWIELPPRPGFTPVQPGWRVPGAPIGEQLPPGQPVNTTPPGGWPWDRDEGGNGGTPPAGGWPWDRDEGGNGGTSPGGWPWDRDEGGTSPNPGIGSIVPPTNRNRECLDHVEIEIPTWDGGNECWPIWRPVALLDPSVVLPGLQPPTTQRPPAVRCINWGPFAICLPIYVANEPPGPNRPDDEEERPANGGGSGRPPASPDVPRVPEDARHGDEARGGEDAPRPSSSFLERVLEWERTGQIRGDLSLLKRRLASSDDATRLAAEAEVLEYARDINKGLIPEVRGSLPGPDQPTYEVKARTEPFIDQKNAENFFASRIKDGNAQFRSQGVQGEVRINLGSFTDINGVPITQEQLRAIVKNAVSKGGRATHITKVVVRDGQGNTLYEGLGE